MLCQKCGKNQATVYYKQNINGNITELALCPECAAKSGITGGFAPMKFPLEGFGFDGFNLFGGNGVPRKIGQTTQKVCTLCGSSLRDISQSGKIPCAKCYEVFRDELSGAIEQIHGKVTHKGRHPMHHDTSVSQEPRKNDAVSELKNQLDTAIKNEEYEKAAQLRDEIRAMNEKNSKGEN